MFERIFSESGWRVMQEVSWSMIDLKSLRLLYETPMPESIRDLFMDERESWGMPQELVYRPPYEFNKIKRPAERYMVFDPEYMRGYRMKKAGPKILNDAWTINLRSNKKEKEYGMFSESEAKFILSSAEEDLKSLKQRKESLVREMAENGVRLSKMGEAEQHLERIVYKLQKALKNEETDEDDE